MVEIRSQIELSSASFNYFIALKLSASETNVKTIEKAISEIQGTSDDDVYGERLKKLVPDIIEVMVNDATYNNSSEQYEPKTGARKREAEAAKRFKLEEVMLLVKNICQNNGMLHKSALQKICIETNKDAKYFQFSDLEKEFIAWNSGSAVKYIDDMTGIKIPLNEFDSATKLLQQSPLKKNNLYEFLEISTKASPPEITQAKKDKYDEYMSKGDRSQRSLGKNLCAYVETILLIDEKREQYDYYIKIREKVWKQFALRKQYGAESITLNEFYNFANIIKDTLKLDIESIEKMLGAGLKTYGLVVAGGDRQSLGLKELEICPYSECGKIFEKGLKSCPHCGKPLEVLCWNCNQKTPFTKEDNGCPTCGATQHGHEVFNKKCFDLDVLLGNPMSNISALQTALLGIKNIVPNYASRTDSKVNSKVKEYESTIQQRVKLEESLGSKYREELAKIQELKLKKHYQVALSIAKSLLVKYSTYNVESSRRIVNEITNTILPAQKFFAAAQQYAAQNNESMAVTYAVKAIDICDDYAEARQILQKYPPKPVSNLRVSANGDKIKLEWEDRIKQNFITYTIIKKIGLVPAKTDDGSVVDRGLSLKFFEDENVISATPYYYAVYTERYGVKSTLCTYSGSVSVFADVKNVRQDIIDGGIKVSWEYPQNIKSIEVWRNDGSVAPVRAGEGTKIECSLNGFEDTNCAGENSYLIVCNYTIDDRCVQSKGVRVVFKPFEKTIPLQQIKIEPIENKKFIFSCAKGYVGKIKLYYSLVPLNIPINKTQRYIEFSSICKGLVAIDSISDNKGNLIFTLPEGRINHVYPIVSTEQLFIVSSPHLINMMEGIKCNHTVSGGSVLIKGSLHEKAKALVVKVNNERYINKIDDIGERLVYKRDSFIKNGEVELQLKADTINYITVFAEFEENGIKSYSLPLRLSPPIDYREPVTVLYHIDFKASAEKSFKITINFEADKQVTIPKLVLMQGHPRPLNKNSGKLCERIDGFTLTKGLFSSKYTAKQVIKADPTSINTKFALFFSDDGGHVQLKEVKKL